MIRLSLTKLKNIFLIIITIPLTLSPLYLLLFVRLGGYTLNLCSFYFYKLIGKLTSFLELQGFICRNMTLTSSTSVSQPSPHISNLTLGIFALRASTLRIILNIDGTPVSSRSHTHPSHTQTSRLLTSSLSLGVPNPRSTQCSFTTLEMSGKKFSVCTDPLP